MCVSGGGVDVCLPIRLSESQQYSLMAEGMPIGPVVREDKLCCSGLKAIHWILFPRLLGAHVLTTHTRELLVDESLTKK